MNHLKLEWGFGIDRDKDQMFITRDESQKALADIKKKAAALFGAYTLAPTYGGWRNGGGRLVEEAGYTLFTIQSKPEAMFADKLEEKKIELAQFIKSSLNQEAVAVTTYPVDFELI